MTLKRILLAAAALSLFTGLLAAQSLQDNPDYRKSLELRQQSEDAFQAGDYDEAKRLAEESQVYAAKSDDWISMMLARYRANSALLRVRNRIEDADRVNGKANFPDAYAQGKALYAQASDEFRAESYADSLATSNKALDALSVIVYVRPDVQGKLPAYYVVRLLPGNTDCLWNIAGYSFVYGDPWKWRLLYDANRDKLPQEANPNLILPDMVLTIPAQDGEQRSGTWRDGAVQ